VVVVDLTGTPLRGMTYTQAQRLLVAAGAGVLGVIALVMYARRVDTVEVLAVLLFVPVFVALMQWNVPGGLAAAAVATVAYIALRASAMEAVGASRFTGLIVARAIGYLVFGALGGWANAYLRASLTKLDLYDQIDDATGLFNARYLTQAIDLETARARRYQSLFSVAIVDIPVAPIAALPRRNVAKLLRELGRVLGGSLRQVDRMVHSRTAEHHRLVAVLPETGAEGAQTFVVRLAARIAELLAARGVDVDVAALQPHAFTHPDDEGALQQLRRDFAMIDQIEHPEAPAPILSS
jgi:GGDEF domain-containing protein